MFDVFIIYNSQGRSKGMAVVNFQRSGDAAEARRKYNGKIIDGRKSYMVDYGVRMKWELSVWCSCTWVQDVL